MQPEALANDKVPNPQSVGAGQGRRMRMVSRGDFVSGIEATLRQALTARLGPAQAQLCEAVLRDVRIGIRGLLERGKPVRGMSKARFLVELERSHSQLLIQRDLARTELMSLREEATHRAELAATREQERREVALKRRAEAEAALGERLRKEVRERGLVPDEGWLELAAQVAADEEERGRREQAALQKAEMAKLERRVGKLTQSLERMEVILAKLSKLKNVDPGAASIYRTVQGLSEVDELFEVKRDMLTHIFEDNQKLLGE